jgi:putative ABC transport system substrate-binding protein
VNRRGFITLLGGAAAWPIAARAQQPRAGARIGLLTVAAAVTPIEAAYLQGLADLGYVEGRNLTIEFRGAAGKEDRLPELAAELVAANVDVILAAGSQATDAARNATTRLPIVMVSTNPLALGFVQSLARPGGNVTGLSLLGPEVSGKRLELLKEMIPGLAKVAVFWNSHDPAARFSLQETEKAAAALNLEPLVIEVQTLGAFGGAFDTARRNGAAAVVLLAAPLISRNAGPIAALALDARLPTLFNSKNAVKAGGLISYGPSLTDVYRRAAYFVDRILNGADPAELPVEQPTKFDLAINQKTAQALGLKIPPTLLATADEVIERCDCARR